MAAAALEEAADAAAEAEASAADAAAVAAASAAHAEDLAARQEAVRLAEVLPVAADPDRWDPVDRVEDARQEDPVHADGAGDGDVPITAADASDGSSRQLRQWRSSRHFSSRSYKLTTQKAPLL